MSLKKIQGVFPVIATPFKEDYSIDEASFRKIIRYVLDAGAHGITYPAVASEFYSLSDDERKMLTEIIIDEVNGKIPVVITTTAASTNAAVDLTQHATDSGADVIMLMTPHIIKENFDGILRYYKTVAEKTDKPIILQNASKPLGSSLSIPKVCRIIDEVPRVEYVKEENSPCGQRITQILSSANDSFQGVFGGAGGRYIMDELKRGIVGVMPACELTEIHVKIYEYFQEGNLTEARALYYKSLPLVNFQAVFRMSMTKEVLRKRGLIEHTNIRTGEITMDKLDLEELHIMLDEIQDLLLSTYEI